jgi:hypothetical protein
MRDIARDFCFCRVLSICTNSVVFRMLRENAADGMLYAGVFADTPARPTP